MWAYEDPLQINNKQNKILAAVLYLQEVTVVVFLFLFFSRLFFVVISHFLNGELRTEGGDKCTLQD